MSPKNYKTHKEMMDKFNEKQVDDSVWSSACFSLLIFYFCLLLFATSTRGLPDSVIILQVTYSRHLNLTDFEVGASCSIALQGKAKTGYPRVSRGSFLSGYGSFLCYYAHFLYILFPSSRILTAAFTSRSIRFPHSHRYVRSDNASSFFLCPHTLHILLDAKYLSTFIRYFPRL